MTNTIWNELDVLTKKIEYNSATIDDYNRYEYLLSKGGLSRDYVRTFLNKAGFKTWNDFVNARNAKVKDERVSGAMVGGLIALGLGLLLAGLFSNDKK
jgi:hypothetical protein